MKILILATALCGAAFGQAVTIGAPIYIGNDLNDATSGGTFAGVGQNHDYRVDVCTAGTPDTIKTNRDTGTSTGCTAIVSGAMHVTYPAGTITGGTWSAGRVVFTDAGHGLNEGARASVTGASPSGYNVSNCSVHVVDSSHFSCALGSDPGTFSSGGTATGWDGVTVTFAATTGHVAGNAWIIRATAAGSASTSGFVQQGIGARFRDAEEKMRDEVSALDFCQPSDVIDGSVNVTGCIQKALDSSTSGSAIYFPPGRYAVCELSVSGKSLLIRGAGSQTSQIIRHSSCLHAHTNMVTIGQANSATIRDIGFNQLGDSSYVSQSGVFITQVNRVVIDSIYATRGQSSCIYIDRGSDIRVVNSTLEQCWWIGVVVSGSGTTNTGGEQPVQRIVISGNTFHDVDYGELVNVFCYDTVIANNVFDMSSIGVAQATYRLTITGNKVHGTHSYGLVENSDGLFAEAAVDTLISNNTIDSPNQRGIFLQGSSIQIPCPVGCGTPGTLQQIPTNHFKIDGNLIMNTGAQPILVHATSPDNTQGKQGSIENNTILNSHSCINVNAQNIKIHGNHCDTTTVQGYVLSGASNIIFDGNTARNIGTVLSGSFDGLSIDAGSHDIIVENNQIIDDQSTPSMRFGIYDGALDVGNASHVTYRNNTVVGSGGAQVYPLLTCTPTNGTWNFGEFRQLIGQTTGGGPAGCQNIVAGSPGTWVPVGLVPDVNGYYTITDPLNEQHLMATGIEHTSGEGDLKCFDLSVPGYKACRTTGHGFKVINGDTGVNLWQVDATGQVSAASESINGNLHLTGTLTPPSGTALNGSTSCSTGQAITGALHSQGIATSLTCGAASPGGATVNDTRLNGCSISTTSTNVCTNAGCTTTASVIATADVSCTQQTSSFVNGLHQ